jgi:hypothetical protein
VSKGKGENIAEDADDAKRKKKKQLWFPKMIMSGVISEGQDEGKEAFLRLAT